MIIRFTTAIAAVETGMNAGFVTGGCTCIADSSSGWSARCCSPGLTGLEVEEQRASWTILGDVSLMNDGSTCIMSSFQFSDSEVSAGSFSVVEWESSVRWDSSIEWDSSAEVSAVDALWAGGARCDICSTNTISWFSCKRDGCDSAVFGGGGGDFWTGDNCDCWMSNNENTAPSRFTGNNSEGIGPPQGSDNLSGFGRWGEFGAGVKNTLTALLRRRPVDNARLWIADLESERWFTRSWFDSSGVV